MNNYLKKIEKILLVLLLGVTVLSFANQVYERVQANNEIIKIKAHEDEILDDKIDILTNEEANKKYSEEVIGYISVPEVDLEAPIVQALSWHEDDMQKAMKHTIAHDPETKLPGEGNNIVLTGHKEEQFGKLENIDTGDKIQLVINNNIFKYEVLETKIVDPYDQEAIDYVYTESSDEILTIYTCYPFGKILPGNDRFVVRAKKI